MELCHRDGHHRRTTTDMARRRRRRCPSLLSAFVLLTLSFPMIAAREHGVAPRTKAGKHWTEMRARMGEDVRLPCLVEWMPHLMIEWYINGEDVQMALDNARPRRKYLEIVNVTRENRGVYVCRAVNGFGSVEVSVKLDVLRPAGEGSGDGSDDHFEGEAGPRQGRKPEFVELYGPLNNKSFTQILEMSSAWFRCAARGDPRPDVWWMKNGRPLGWGERDAPSTLVGPMGIGGHSSTGDHRYNGDTLYIKELQRHHTGNYTCMASNVHGTINATYVLDVVSRTPQKPVLIDGHPMNTSVEMGGTASFQCRVKSDAMPHIQWLKRIDDDHHHHHHQQLQQKPVVSQQQQQQHHNNGTILFEGSRYKVLKSSEVVERKEGLYLNKLLLCDIQGLDSGTYVCMAANTMGYSFKSAHLLVTSSDGGPWQVTSHDVYRHSQPTENFPTTLVVFVPLAAIGSMLLVFLVLQCRRHASPVGGTAKTAVVPPRSVGSGIAASASPQKTAAPLLGGSHVDTSSAESRRQWSDSVPPQPSQTLLGGAPNDPTTWLAYQHEISNGGHQAVAVAPANRKSGTPPNGSLRDSRSTTSGTVSLPKKVHHHHHCRQHHHHHQHVYYDQDGWQNPFQC